MSWSTITVADVLKQFTPLEQAALQNIQGEVDSDNLEDILTSVVEMARGCIRAGGNKLGEAGAIPGQVRLDVVTVARWEFIISFPQMKNLQTPERKSAYEAAMKRFEKIASGETKVESPVAPDENVPREGNWNSENKILMRTHPVPRPPTPGDTDYAND